MVNTDNVQPAQIRELVSHLFRTEAGRITALLTGIFGLKQIEIAEDIVQETLIDALNQWSVGEIPKNPSAWLLQVAKHKTINLLKREQKAQLYAQHERTWNDVYDPNWENHFQEEVIEDNQLRMIFTCCHPGLPVESQIALTLKTLCGLSVPEIAHALVTTTSNVNKRLYRAKSKFRNEEIDFKLPAVTALPQRLEAVYLTLYLLFNEGYNASHHDDLIREDLCIDAIRLTTMVAASYESHPRGYALLALMYLHGARFNARLDKQGGIIIFGDQNREQWDQDMIRTGLHYLSKASKGLELSSFHLEAGIAAEHCLSKSIDATNWESIYKQYQLLYKIKPNPIIALNLAIISSRLEGTDYSIQKLHQLEKDQVLNNYYLLASTLGHFYAEKKEFVIALRYLHQALDQTHSPAESKLIKEKIQKYERFLQ